MSRSQSFVSQVLEESRLLVEAEFRRLFAACKETGYGPLYDHLAVYPFREGKSLRPAILISTCTAMGGKTYQAITSAAALELFHNAAINHDDVQDVSDFRRGEQTLFRQLGVPIAINVGDATNVLAISLLLQNVEKLGVRKALQILREFERMSRESVEGQAMDLDWIRTGCFDLGDQDYINMVYKKTCWYTTIAPMRIGIICGSAVKHSGSLDDYLQDTLELGFATGVAFQIQDDLLNLTADEVLYGKEISGDLYEGKRTIMLLHFLRSASVAKRDRALNILRFPRREKTAKDIKWLHREILNHGSIEYGQKIARKFADRAIALEPKLATFMQHNAGREFIREVLNYMVERLK